MPEPTAADFVRAILADLPPRPVMEQIGPVLLRHIAPVMRDLRIAQRTWPCVCGHLEHERFIGGGPCLREEPRFCSCVKYRPAPLTEALP